MLCVVERWKMSDAAVFAMREVSCLADRVRDRLVIIVLFELFRQSPEWETRDSPESGF
jgi:hypothetical protein